MARATMAPTEVVANMVSPPRRTGRSAVTLISLSLIVSLTIYEFVDYRRVHMVSTNAHAIS